MNGSVRALMVLALSIPACAEADFSDQDTASAGTLGDGESDGDSNPAFTTQDPDDDDGDAAEDSTTGPSEEDDTGEPLPSTCAPTEACLPAIPEGWQGPITLVDEALAAECPASMPQETLRAHNGLTADPASCACECGTPADTSCTMQLWGRAVECADEDFFPNANTVVSGTCDILTSAAVAWIHDADEDPPVSGGACPPVANHSFPEPVWDETLRACEAPSPAGACEDDGVCVPDDVSTPMCIVHPGDVECPEGPWEAKTGGFENVADERACSDCLCSSPAGQCSGSFEFYEGSNCDGDPLGSYASSSQLCIDEPNADRVEFVPDGALAECSPIGGAPSGEATPADPVTICCLP